MMLYGKLWDNQSHYIHPDGDMNVCTTFRGKQSNTCEVFSHKKTQKCYADAGGKVKDKSLERPLGTMKVFAKHRQINVATRGEPF